MFSCVHPHLVHIDAVELLLIHTDHSKGHPGRAEHPHAAILVLSVSFFGVYLCFVSF